jgi:hypothetical protein
MQRTVVVLFCLAVMAALTPSAAACICSDWREGERPSVDTVLSRTDVAAAGIITQIEQRAMPHKPRQSSSDLDGNFADEMAVTIRVVRILPLDVRKGGERASEDIWLYGGSSCDCPLIVGMWFNVLAQDDEGHLIGNGSYCTLEEDLVFGGSWGGWIYLAFVVVLVLTVVCLAVLVVKRMHSSPRS